ncbi:hypothetical protein ACTFIU_011469 [Dictyostelium citrinum]
MKIFKVNYLSIFIFISLILSFANSEYLKIDSFDNSTTCKDKLSIYSTEWIKLNYCDGNIIYRFVPPNVGEGITDNSTTTTASSNSSTTGNSSLATTTTTIITSSDIFTTAISSMTGFGAINADFLLESTDSQDNSNNEIQTTTTSNDIGTTSTSSTTTKPTTTTTSSQTKSSTTTTTTTSISITTTGIFQGGMGNVVKYYCLSIGCSAQCVSIQAFPLGVCTSSNGLDNVLYSIVDNTSSIITKSTNITNPGSNNGFCQSFISPKSCISSLNKVSQYNNDHCGKGLKVNCTGSLYSTFTCLDNDCNQCTQTNSYQLNKCIQLNNGSSGAVFRSVLKIPITDFTLPPLDSSNSDYDSLIPRDSSSSSSSYF